MATDQPNGSLFWNTLDDLAHGHEIIVDRPQGSVHPRQADMIYPLDYGYLAGTTAGDGDGIDVWVGSIRPAVVTGVVCTVDSRKRDAEVKILLGCTRDEETAIMAFLNTGLMAAVLVSAPPPSATP